MSIIFKKSVSALEKNSTASNLFSNSSIKKTNFKFNDVLKKYIA